MLSRRQLSTGDRVASYPLAPASARRARLCKHPLLGLSMTGRRPGVRLTPLWVCKTKEREGKNQSDPRFHQLLSQGLFFFKKVSRSFVKLKCLEKPKEVEAASPSKGCVLLPPESLGIHFSFSRNQTESKLLHKKSYIDKDRFSGTLKS